MSCVCVPQVVETDAWQRHFAERLFPRAGQTSRLHRLAILARVDEHIVCLSDPEFKKILRLLLSVYYVTAQSWSRTYATVRPLPDLGGL